MEYEKIIGMKVVNGKIQFIRQTVEVAEDADEATTQAIGISQDLSRGTYTTKIMRPAKGREIT